MVRPELGVRVTAGPDTWVHENNEPLAELWTSSVIVLPSTAELLLAWVMSALLPELPEHAAAACPVPSIKPIGSAASDSSRSRLAGRRWIEVVMVTLPRFLLVFRYLHGRPRGGGTAELRLAPVYAKA